MIKIKVKDVMGETEVSGTESELIADAGMVIWTLKKMMQKKTLDAGGRHETLFDRDYLV